MIHDLPTLRQLSYFIALSDTLHFGQAADLCYVTQSTLSLGIKELENQLNIQLFERDKRNVSLTPAGSLLLQKARHIVTATQDLVHTASFDQGQLTGTLQIGLSHCLSPRLLPQLLTYFKSSCPDLHLQLYQYPTAQGFSFLKAGQIDLYFFAKPWANLDGVEQQKLYDEQLFLILPKNHPLTHHVDITLDLIPYDELLLLDDSHCFIDQIYTHLPLNQEYRLRAYRPQSIDHCLHLVNQRYGITLLPESALVQVNQYSSLETRVINVDSWMFQREIHGIWRKTSWRAPTLKVCMEELRHWLEMSSSSL